MDCTVVLMVLSTVSHLRFSSASSYGTPPSFTSKGEPPPTYVVDVQQGGNNLVLPCEVSGTSPITVSWFREGILLRENTLDEENNGTLSIRVTEAEANIAAPRKGANYHCEATNRIGPGSYNATLRSRNVTVSHYFFGGFRNTEMREVQIRTVFNGEVIMECDFNPSNPDPEVTWFAGGTTMLDDSSDRQFLEGGRYLYIKPVDTPLFGKRYHCELRNSRYENGMPMRAPTTYMLTNLANDEFIVYKELGSRVGMVGETTEFLYAAAGRDSTGLNLPVTLRCPLDSQFTFVYSSPILLVTVREASAVDQLTFSCSLFALDRTANGTIIITERASITSLFSDPDLEIIVGNEPVQYFCEISGRPAPTITWYYNRDIMLPGTRNGVEVSNNRTQLTIEEPQVHHSGIYQCFVRNQLDDDSRTWTLEVTAPEIGIVLLSSSLNTKFREISYGLLLLVPSNATDLVITAMVNSTIVSGVPKCPSSQWKIDNTNITTDTNSDYEATDSCDSPSNLSYTFNLTIRNRLAERTMGNYTVIFTLLGDIISNSQGLFVIHSEYPVITNIIGAEERISVESNLELECMYNDRFPTSIIWSKDGSNLTSNNRISITLVMSGVSALRITSVTLEDAGVYTCIAESEVVQDRQEVTLEVFESSSCVDVLGSVFAVLFAVEVVITVLLFSEVPTATNHPWQPRKLALSICHGRKSDLPIQCHGIPPQLSQFVVDCLQIAVNELQVCCAGALNPQSTLLWLISGHGKGDVPPSFASEGQPPRVVLVDLQGNSDNLVLPCRVTGTPTPTVTWFMNNVLIDQASVMADGTLSIRVTDAEAPYEGINYYCLASSMIGPANLTVATLRSRDVLVSSSAFRESEVATVGGGDVALECAFNPIIAVHNVTWFVNDLIITESSRVQLLEEGRYLYIQQLTAVQREMRYHCEVNSNGRSIRLPTTYTLNTDIDPGILMVYKNQSTVSGRVGVPVVISFAAAAIRTAGTAALNIFLDCVDNELVDFGESRGTVTTLTLLEPARTMNQVTFTCVILVVDLPRKNVSGTIIVSDLPASITTPMSDDPSLTDREHKVGGGPVEYSCESSGRPAPTITWYFNGAVVQSGSGGVVVGDDGTLTISAPQVSHSGIYQCFTRNQFGDDSRAWILEVLDPVIENVGVNSEFEIEETSQGDLLLLSSGTTDLVITSMVGSTAIRNVATCDSCPQVQWKINSTNITTDSGHTVSSPCNGDFTSPYIYTLTIANLTAETSGNYSVVFTLLGVVRESPGLFVSSSAISISTGITGPQEPLDVGSELELQCMFIEIFPTNVVWSRDGNNLNSDNQIKITHVMNGLSTLRILSVTVEDAGVYTCSARSEVNRVSLSITVKIPNSGGGVGCDAIGVMAILVIACSGASILTNGV